MDNASDSNQPPSSAAANQATPPWISSPSQPTTGKTAAPPPESPQPVSDQPTPTPQVKKSPFSKLIPLLFLILLGVGLYFLVTRVVLPLINKTKEEKSSSSAEEEITLNYWGLWESEEVMKVLIDEYQKQNPKITIQYKQQSHKDYRERLQSALAKGEGPDIFRFHNTWLAMLKKELAPAPSAIAKTIDLEKNFYSVINQDLKVGSQVFGVPLGFDGLALFYNPKILQEGGKTFPTTWDELRRTAIDLTVYDENKKIQIAGVALGTTSNVDHFSDILGLMMLQNGVDLSKPSGALAEDALKFYTLFSLTDRVWDETLSASVYAFAAEKVAMVFAPSWRAHEIKQINPKLEFKTAPVPQLPGTEISWASYWVEGVSSQSENSQAAWQFLAYLSSSEALSEFYNQAAKVRDFGEAYPRKELASQIENDPVVGAFVKQAPYAQSWYLCSQTHDNGINDKIIKYFEDAVNAMLDGESATTALEPVAQGVPQILTQYGIQ